jgi:hypothetical protein
LACPLSGRYPPHLSQSSEQTRPGRSAEGLMPNAARERVANPRAITNKWARQIQTSYCFFNEILLARGNRSLAFSMSRVAEKPK